MSSRSTTPESGDAAGGMNALLKTPTRDSLRESLVASDRGGAGSSNTARKPDIKRRYSVRITDDEPSGIDVSDSLDDSEAELQRARRDVSRLADTTFGDDDSSNTSNATGVRQALSRRSAAGISLKDSEERIKKLEAENSELRIECDLWRQQMRPDEARNKIVSISKDLAKQRKSNVEYMRILREQDNTMKESRRMLKRWGGLDPKDEIRKREDLERKLEDAIAAADREKHARQRAEEELQVAKSAADGEAADESQLSRMRQLLEDQRDDHAEEIYTLQRQRDELEHKLESMQDDTSRNATVLAEVEDLQADVADLRTELKRKDAENEDLINRLDEIQQARSRQETELEDLRAELQHAQAADDSHTRELEVAQQRLEHLTADQQDGDERIRLVEAELAEKLGAQIDHLRDELTASKLDVRSKEEQIEDLERQREDDDVRLQELELELERAANAIEERNEDINNYVQEVDELNVELQQTKKDLEDADLDIRDLQEVIKNRSAEVADANQELQEISQKLMEAEDEVEALKEETAALDAEKQDLATQLQDVRERSERRELAYKERLGQTEQLKAEIQSQLEAIEKDYQNAAEDSRVLGRDVDGLQQEKKDLQIEMEKLYEKLDDAIEDLKEEEKKREQLEDELERRLDAEESKWRALVDEKEEAISSLERELEGVQESLAHSKGDVAKLQDALRDKENESVRLGQTHTSDRYSLELEIDRLMRDLGRCEEDLERHRREVERKEDSAREKETRMSSLHFEMRELASKLAAESQTRIGLEERIEAQRKVVADAQREVEQYRAKIGEIERQANVGERSSKQTESHIKNQISERNSLLLSVYQYLGKLLGNATPRKRGEGDLKPFTNFAVFHESLIARLRRLSDVQVQFEQKSKLVEEKFSEKLTALKRQQDSRFRQIDRLEVAVKNAVDKQGQWRARVVSKQTEVDSIKATNSELQQQIAALKARGSLSSPADASKINALTARANNAERRLTTIQNQSSIAEDRLTEAKNKYAEGEGKWAARIKELESRCKAADERVKRERQGAKERVVELEEEVQRTRKALEQEKRRVKELDPNRDTAGAIAG